MQQKVVSSSRQFMQICRRDTLQWRLFDVNAQHCRHQGARTTLATTLGVQLFSHIAAAVDSP